MPVTIYRHELQQLIQEVRSKFERECLEKGITPPQESQQYFGYGPFIATEEPGILRWHLAEHPSVKALLSAQHAEDRSKKYARINGKDLYDRGRQLEKNPDLNETTLNNLYESVYFLYLDCADIDAFRKKFLPQQRYAPLTVSFECHYYSFKAHALKRFHLDLIFAPGGKINAVQHGFMDQKPQIVFKGSGRLYRNCLRLALEHEGEFMDMYLHMGDKDPQTAGMFLGLLITQSSSNFPISVETLLINKNLHLEAEDTLQIKRFLFLKRHHYRTFDHDYTSPQQLKIKKNLVNMIAQLAGHTYRVWSYTRSGDVVQSKFIIQQDYSATLLMSDKLYEENEQEQMCALAINDLIHQRLIVTMHPKAGIGVIGTCILEIPTRRSAVFTGVTCGIGLRGKKPALAYIALLRDDASDFTPDIFASADLAALVAGNEHLAQLQKTLGTMQPKTAY